MSERIDTIGDVPDELLTELEVEVQDLVENYTSEAMDRLPVTKAVMLQALEKSVKEALRAQAPKANPREDDLEKAIRREAAIKDAASAAYDIIDQRCDGTEEEHDHLVVELLGLVAKKVAMSTQRRLLSRDVLERVGKIVVPA